MSFFNYPGLRPISVFTSPAQSFAGPYDRPLTPAVLDAMAGIELQHGHHVRAEYLANRAAELREVGR